MLPAAALLTVQAARVLAQVNYDFIVWPGNTTAYLYCDLPLRGPQYVGTCISMDSLTCVASNNVSNPFACTNATSVIAGNISDTSYRLACEIPCAPFV